MFYSGNYQVLRDWVMKIFSFLLCVFPKLFTMNK